MTAGAKPRDLPAPPEPPQVGWRNKDQQQDRAQTKAARWLARHPEITTSPE